jgi:hypothetical protein
MLSAARRTVLHYKTNVKEEVKNMKKLLFAVTVLTVIAFTFGAMAAQQKAAPAPEKAASAKEAWHAARGVIEKIDAATKTFEANSLTKVKGKYVPTGKMTTIATDDKTKFFTLVKGKEKKVGFADLKVGMTIGFTYKIVEGKNLALSVEVR